MSPAGRFACETTRSLAIEVRHEKIVQRIGSASDATTETFENALYRRREHGGGIAGSRARAVDASGGSIEAPTANSRLSIAGRGYEACAHDVDRIVGGCQTIRFVDSTTRASIASTTLGISTNQSGRHGEGHRKRRGSMGGTMVEMFPSSKDAYGTGDPVPEDRMASGGKKGVD